MSKIRDILKAMASFVGLCLGRSGGARDVRRLMSEV